MRLVGDVMSSIQGNVSPLFKLKHYQQKTLDELEAYLKAASQLGADTAFYDLTKRPYTEVPLLPELPYICLRLPTGGGKTVMASHAINITADHWLDYDYPLVLWLVPSNAIREQTLKALKNREHPYRVALSERFGNNVQIMETTDALYVSRSDLQSNCCVIVSTIQSFRVDDKEGRKVYEADGALMDHFSGLDERQLECLERDDDGTPIPSLENAIRLHRPMVIVDEAHNVRSKLSFETLKRLAPSLIIEFTATPQLEHDPEKDKFASNVLAHVSALELKAEEMIKLPVHLRGRTDWKLVIGDALAHLNLLDEIARAEEAETGEFIRPVMLLQAQSVKQSAGKISVADVKKSLTDDHSVPENQIAIATGTEWELENVDLMQRGCPIRFVITQKALREGWDCPFAYILCSVAEQSSGTAVEQIIGRVLRMPNAKRKKREELNQAYVFSATQSFQNTANTLADGLVKNGFEKIEAAKLIRAPQDDLTGFSEASANFTVEETLPEELDYIAIEKQIEKVTSGRVSIDAKSKTIKVSGFLSDTDRQSLKLKLPELAATSIDKLYRRSRGLPITDNFDLHAKPEFRVPLMAVLNGKTLELFDRTHYLGIPWRLEECDPKPLLEKFVITPGGLRLAEIDITGEETLRVKFIDELNDQLSMMLPEPGWTLPSLVKWLDRMLPDRKDITPFSSQKFLRAGIEILMKENGISLDLLARHKFRLRNVFARLIFELRFQREKQAFDDFLFGTNTPIRVTSEVSHLFNEQNSIGYNQPYKGRAEFKKHYFDIVGDLKADGEEHECAVYLDNHPQVEYWVRNPVNQKGSFWLQTSKDRFYPDFVCLLTDGRCAAVEYKGAHLFDASDAQEKDLVGKLWAERSEGNCLFVMPTNRDFSEIDRAIAN